MDKCFSPTCNTGKKFKRECVFPCFSVQKKVAKQKLKTQFPNIEFEPKPKFKKGDKVVFKGTRQDMLDLKIPFHLEVFNNFISIKFYLNRIDYLCAKLKKYFPYYPIQNHPIIYST